MAYDNLLRRISDREMIMPFFEMAMLKDVWPKSYNIKIDSSPYYGLNADGSPDGYFHPSTHPLMSERQLYYMMHPDTRDKMVRERPTLRGQMTLAMGSALHGVVQTQMQMAGLIGSEDNLEVEYIIPEHHVRGRIDWITHHPEDPELIVEMKTINSYGFKALEGVKPSWDAQLSLAEYARGKNYGILLAVESGWPYSCREFRHRRNDILLDEIFTKFAHVRECIASNTPPTHCCLPDSSAMKSCPARYSCWLKPDEKVL